ncbi:MAG: HAMP domain-containing histidine kinase [Flavobacteriaceae bacterium]|jgi:two-component system phosphate regulon sensor histidine kinase PhoR|nr:HAMP domain-containing histidine kinase [Flavobacteriaceae bacterium]
MKKLNSKGYFIVFCSFFLLLMGMMSFYIYNVYQLKCKEIISTVNQKIDKLEESKILDKFTIKKENEQYLMLLDVVHNKMSLDDFRKKNKQVLRSREAYFTALIDSVFAADKYNVAIRYDLTQIVLYEPKRELLQQPISLLQTTQPIEKSYKTNTSNWEVQESSKSTDDEKANANIEKDYKHHFSLYQQQYIDIKNITSIALLSLMPLLVLTIVIAISIVFIYYITYRTIKQKEREVSNLYNMVDNVSHEFKLPIATLKYGCNNLKQEYNSPTIQLLLRQVDRLDRLQNTLNPTIKIDSQPYTQANLLQMIEDLKQLYTHVLFSVQWNVDGQLQIDQTKAETILLNLIENSAKYSGTHIECEITATDNTYIFLVTDNGMGIPKDQQQDIFKKFYRIRQGNIHDSNGLGIGLYQVQQLVMSLNGKIEIHSTLQKGTTFKIILPYV